MRNSSLLGIVILSGITALPGAASADQSGALSSASPHLVSESCAGNLDHSLKPGAGETGWAKVSYLIGADGQVLDTRVDQSSGSKSIEAVASMIYKRCSFTPAFADGKPVPGWITLKYFNAPD